MSKLKDRRTQLGITQQQLADASGLSVRMIQNYEQGVNDFNGAAALTVYKVARALYCKVEDIIDIETV